MKGYYIDLQEKDSKGVVTCTTVEHSIYDVALNNFRMMCVKRILNDVSFKCELIEANYDECTNKVLETISNFYKDEMY